MNFNTLANCVLAEATRDEIKLDHLEDLTTVIKYVYNILLKKGYPKESMVTGEQFLSNFQHFLKYRVSQDDINDYWFQKQFFDAKEVLSDDPTRVTQMTYAYLQEVVAHLKDEHRKRSGDAFAPFLGTYISYGMAHYPLNNIVRPFNEWRKIQDKYDTAKNEIGVDLDI